jgi:hypothetical protein
VTPAATAFNGRFESAVMADDAGGDPDAPPEDDHAGGDYDHADPDRAGALHHVELCAADLDSYGQL